jgi:hypothetical protein
MIKRAAWIYGPRSPRGVMNKTEQHFLDTWILPGVQGGRIKKWWYEKWRFTLTEPGPGRPGIGYTPDFILMLSDGELQCYEVKGVGNARLESVNRTKLFRDDMGMRTFIAWQLPAREGGGFRIEEIAPSEEPQA